MPCNSIARDCRGNEFWIAAEFSIVIDKFKILVFSFRWGPRSVRPFLIVGRVKYEFRGFMFSKLVKSLTQQYVYYILHSIGDTNEEKTSFLCLVLVSILVSAQKLVFKNRENRISMLPI